LQSLCANSGACNELLPAPLPTDDTDMLHRSLSPAASPRGGASSLLRLGIGSAPPHAAAPPSQRPFVLARHAFGSQQLSLFGPPGGGR